MAKAKSRAGSAAGVLDDLERRRREREVVAHVTIRESGAGSGKFATGRATYTGYFWSYFDLFARDGSPAGGGPAVWDEGDNVLWVGTDDADALAPGEHTLRGTVHRGVRVDRESGRVRLSR